MKSLRRIRLYTNVCKIDDDLLNRSRVARAGRSLIQLAIFVRAIEPVLALVTALLLLFVRRATIPTAA